MRGKPNWDWVSCLGYAASNSVNGITDPPTGILLVAPRQTSFSTPLSIGIPDEADQLTAHRIVGQIEVENATAGPLRCCLRIGTVLLDNAGLFSAFSNSLFNAFDANEPFLWQRYMRLPAGDNTLSSTRDPMWSHVDIRVKRTIDSQQALALFVQVDVADPVNMNVRPYLRTLVKVK